MTVIALVRHGRTTWNDVGRIQGSSDVTTLDEVGHSQALAASLALIDEPYEWDTVVSSPKRRALDTADIIASRLGVTVAEIVPDLAERHFGAAEGLLDDVARSRWPDGSYPNREDTSSVIRRGRAALAHIATAWPDGHVVAVSHGGLIRHTLRSLTERKDIPVIANGSASIVVFDPATQGWSVESVNDVAAG